MKRLVIAVAATMLCLGATAGNPLKWGVKAGLNYQTTEVTASLWKDMVSAKSRVGWHAGLQASWRVGIFSVDPELLFSRNSYKFTTDAGVSGTSYQHTIDVPIALGVRIVGPLKVQAGVNLNVMTDCGVKGEKDRFRFSTESQALGYLLGLGVDLGHINIMARYNGYFRNNEGRIFFGSTSASDDMIKTRVGTWQLGVGFYF